MKFPLTSILYLFGSLVCYFSTWRLHRAYEENRDVFCKYFRNMALCGGIGSMVYSFIAMVFTHNSFALGIGNIVGETFYLLTFVYGITTFFYLSFPDISQKKVIYVGIVLIGLITISHIKFFPYPTIDKLGILQFNAPPIPRWTYTLFSIAGLVPLTLAFLREAIKKPHLRIRSSLLAGSMFALTISGAIQSVVTRPMIYALAYLIQTIGFASLFGGIIARTRKLNE